MYFTYILYSSTYDRFYYGQTDNLESRLIRHNKGKVKSTKGFIPWEIYAYQVFESRAEAIVEERKLKNLKSKKRLLVYIESKNYKKVER